MPPKNYMGKPAKIFYKNEETGEYKEISIADDVKIEFVSDEFLQIMELLMKLRRSEEEETNDSVQVND